MKKEKDAKKAKATDTEKGKAKDGGETNLTAATKAKAEETNRNKTTLTAKQKRVRQTRYTLPSSKAIAITVDSGDTLEEIAARD